MRTLFTLLAFLATALPAAAFDTPKALLDALYAPYFKADMDFSGQDALRSIGLKALFDADAKDANGEVGRIDFDPYIQGQDWDTKSVTIGKPEVLGGTARVVADFTNFDRKNHLTYSLVLERDGWKVDDVYWLADGDFPATSLRELLTAPFP